MVPYGSHRRRINLHRFAPKPARKRLLRRRQPDALTPRRGGVYVPFCTKLHRFASLCTGEKSKYTPLGSNQ